MLFNSKKKQKSQEELEPTGYSRRANKHSNKGLEKNLERKIMVENADFVSESIEVNPSPVTKAQEQIPTKVKKSHRSLIFLFSVVAAVTSVALPYMTYFANSIQSQELFVGYLLNKGSLPYSSIYGTSGILFYGIIALSYALGSSAWLAVIQFIIQYISGIYVDKILLRLTNKESVALLGTLLFGLSQVTFGFGGLYATQLALPFILLGIWFLVRYFENRRADEWFIYYGILSAISYFIDPKTIIFWLLALVVVCLNNIGLKRYARGFYQFLSIIMGTILVLYPSAYVLLSMQVFNDYLAQTDLKSLFYPGLTNSNPWITILIQLFFLISTGLIIILRKGFAYLRSIENDKWIQNLFFITFIAFLPYVLFSQTYEPHTLLVILPFALFILLPILNQEPETMQNQSNTSRSKRIKQSDFSILIQKYKVATRYLILVSMLTGIAFAGYHVYQTQSLATERKQVTKALKANDSIYIWDNTVQLYKTTNTKPRIQFALPVNYTGNVSTRNALVDSLLADKDDYIVVNQSIPMTTDLKNHIEENYEAVKIDNVKHYVVYQKK